MERRRRSRCRQDLRTDGPAALSLAARPSEARAPAGALFRGPALCRASSSRDPTALFRLGRLFPRPGTSEPVKPAPGGVIEEPAREAEDCAFHREGGGELSVGDVAVLGLGRLLIIDEAPNLLEHLLRQQPGQEAAGDAEGQKE